MKKALIFVNKADIVLILQVVAILQFFAGILYIAFTVLSVLGTLDDYSFKGLFRLMEVFIVVMMNSFLAPFILLALAEILKTLKQGTKQND